MKTFWKRLLPLLLISSYACQPQRKIINSYSKPLTEAQLQTELAERNAELVFKEQRPESTLVLLETEDSFSFGSFSAVTFEYSDQTSEIGINHSLYVEDSDSQASVDAGQLGIAGKKQGKDFHEEMVVGIVRDEALQQKYKKVRFTFSDKSQIVAPASNQKGLVFTYDDLEKGKCTKLELLSETDEVLYSVNL